MKINPSRKTFWSIVASGAIGVFGVACGQHAKRPATPTDPNVAKLLDWIGEHRDDASILAYSAGEATAEDAIALNERSPRVLASTAKIVVLGAYAREVSASQLDPDEQIPRRDLDAWYLPNSDDGAHVAAMSAIGAAPTEKLRLDDVARAMIEFSDNAATDYLLDRLGPDAIASAAAEMGMTGQRLPLRPTLGATLAFADQSLGDTPLARARALVGLREPERSRVEQRLVADYQRSPRDWQARFDRALQELGADKNGLAAQLEIGPKLIDWRGIAADYASVVERASTGKLIDAKTSAIVHRHLASWASASELVKAFERFGGKDGLSPGIRTIAAFGVPKSGEYAGKTRVVVIFLNRLDGATFISLMQSDAIEQLAAGLAQDPELAAYVREHVVGQER
ncbi:MAG: serine hydrolase [Gaiellaceae bacterium]